MFVLTIDQLLRTSVFSIFRIMKCLEPLCPAPLLNQVSTPVFFFLVFLIWCQIWMASICLLSEGITPRPGDAQTPLKQPASPSVSQSHIPGENYSPAEHKTAEQKPCDNPGPLNAEVRYSQAVVFQSLIFCPSQKPA